MNKQHLAELLGEWQQRLRLVDWQISVEFAYEEEFENRVHIAESTIAIPEQRASIRIQHPEQLRAFYGETPTPEGLMAGDPEVMLVHELLHVRLEPCRRELNDDSAALLALEQHIELTARALVCLKRKDT